ncbi:MAG: methyltetrahydrofolate cobalamin methyltransferase [Candidatus Abyssubacteria bacterium]
MGKFALTTIGERINSTRKRIARAIEGRDELVIQQEARLQHEAGVDYIDVNAGIFLEQEPECLSWLVRTVQAAVDAPLSLDSPNPRAIEAALREHKGRAIINSITYEPKRMEAIVPLLLEHSCKVIALAIDSVRVPPEATRKIEIGVALVEELTGAGVAIDDIYLDPVIQPVGVAGTAGVEMLDAVSGLRQRFPDVHILCGLANISYNLPHRMLLNAMFLPMAMAAGADTAIIDPCENFILSTIFAAEALLGHDEYCMRYIAAHREGKLGNWTPPTSGG